MSNFKSGNLVTIYKLSLFLFLNLISVGLILCQPHSFQTGWSENEEVYNQLNISTTDIVKGELPAIVDLTRFSPTPKDQGLSGSCVGWAAGYASMTIQYAIANDWNKSEVNQNSFSALYLYHHVKKGDCLSGTTLIDAGNFLSESGNCKRTSYGILVNDCDDLPPNEVNEEALLNTILDYNALFRSNALAKEKITKIRLSLSDSIPVVIGMKISNSFVELKDNTWNLQEGDTTSLGGHALTIIGYDDFRRSFKVMNCWGENWGEGGFAWIKYNDLATYCSFAIQYIIPDLPTGDLIENNKGLNAAVSGEVSIRYPYFPDPFGDNYEFRKAKINATKDQLFELSKEIWEIGNQYQILVSGLAKKSYVYVFSIDNKGVNIHFPRSEKYSDGILGSRESPLRPKGRGFIIPGDDIALERREIGRDYLFILLSSNKIDDFRERISILTDVQIENVIEAFRINFSDLIISKENINYKIENTLKVNSTSTERQSIIPIIIAVNE